MRIYKKFLIAILSAGLSLMLVPQSSFAAEDLNLRKEGGDYLVKLAKTAYARGQYEDAAHEFSKALLIDPENKEALEGLRAMGIDRGLYADVRTSLTNTVEISRNFKVQEMAENTILSDSSFRKNQFIGDRSDCCVKQDQLGNLSKDIEDEITRLQNDLIASRSLVEKAEIPQNIKKAEKSMQKADMTLAEGLLASNEKPWDEGKTTKTIPEKKLDSAPASLVKKEESSFSQSEETISMPVEERPSFSERKVKSEVLDKKMVLGPKEEIQKPLEGKNVNLLAVSDEKIQQQANQTALAYEGQVKQKGKHSAELFSYVPQEENVAAFEQRIEKSAQEALAYDKDLKAIFAEQNRMRQELFEQEQYNRKMFALLEDYLYAYRGFAQEAITQKIMAQIDSAQTQNALWDRNDELVRLYKDLDYYLARNYEKDDLIDEKHKDVMFFRDQLRHNPDMRLLWEKLEKSQQNIIEKRQKINELEERIKTITVQ